MKVLHDLAGFNRNFRPRFVKAFEDGFDLVQRAVDAFDRDVENGTFPTDAESYQ